MRWAIRFVFLTAAGFDLVMILVLGFFVQEPIHEYPLVVLALNTAIIAICNCEFGCLC